MNRKLSFTVLLFLLSFSFVFSQQRKNSRFFIETHAGVFYNFGKNFSLTNRFDPYFSTASYGGIDYITMYVSSSIGNSLGIGLYYKIDKKFLLGFNYSRTVNTGFYSLNFEYPFPYPAKIKIEDARVADIINYYEIVYKRNVYGKNRFYWELGGYFINPVLQWLFIFVPGRDMVYAEGTAFNQYNYLSFGFFAGIDYIVWRSNNFDLGFNSRVYYTAFDDFWEGMQINFITRYHF